jgi:diguanylate cyclase (GGDEF)-like protein/PAS domain S-box-containing protein
MSDSSLTAAAHVLLSSLEEGVVIASIDGSLFVCNEAAERILGLTPNQLRGTQAIDPNWRVSSLDGSDWPPEDFPIERAMRDGYHSEQVIMHVHRDADDFCSISVNARPVVIDDQIVAGVATFTDVTAEYLAASQASDNQRQLLEGLHASGLAVATSDGRGRLLTANATFAEMVGRSPAQLQGMHYTEISGPDALDDQLAAVERLHDGKEEQFRTLKSYVRPDGSLRHALMNLLVLRNHLGEVERHVSLVQDVTDQLNNEAALTVEARTDSLTGLLNRRGVLAALDDALSGGRDRRLLVAFIDLDGFKGINDTYGHETGDLTLRRVADAMQESVRGTDVLGRLGGDEFVVIFMDAPASLADRLADSLRTAVEAVTFDEHPLPLSASVGIVAPERGESALAILRRADAAMYANKRTGRSVTAAMEKDLLQ